MVDVRTHVPHLFALLIAGVLLTPDASGADQCLVCHRSMADKPSTLFAGDVHRQSGITCAGCHGGNDASADPDVAMNRKKGFLGAPKGDAIVAMCAQCHEDEAKQLRASVHGKLSTTGKESILQCTTCHGAHGIVRVTDPRSPVHPLHVVATCTRCHNDAAYIRAYNPSLPVDQLEKYRTSVHGKLNSRGDAKAAACASCHGSHGILSSHDVNSLVYPTQLPHTCSKCHSDAEYMKSYGIPTDQYEKFARSVHGVALLQKNDLGAPACNKCHGNHGATPPGVESISKVCGTCHALNADLFSASPHKGAFDKARLPECETCHGNHAILAAGNAMLGISGDAVCSRCHTERKSPSGFRSAALMRQLADSLTAEEETARQLVEEAEQKGMEIGEAKYALKDIRQARLEARTMVHAFDEQKFRTVAEKGMATAATVETEARTVLDEYVFRRVGLGVATLIITLLAAGIYVYLRRMEKRSLQK
jgi:predicted CXXCH cytochrome family protein